MTAATPMGSLFRRRGGDAGGEQPADESAPEEDDEQEVQTGDHEVVARDQQEEILGQVHGFGHGCEVGDAAGVDAGHGGAHPCEVGVAESRVNRLAVKEKEPAEGDCEDAAQSDEEGLERGFRRPRPEVTAQEHQRDGEQHRDIGDVGAELAGAFAHDADIADGQPDDIEDDHRGDLLDDGPSLRRQHHEQRDGKKVE